MASQTAVVQHEGTSWPGPRGRHGGVDEVPLPATAAPGRLWLCGKHYVGPDPEAALAAVGATVVVCLNERHELADRYPAYVTWLGAQPATRAVWHPIPDLGAPSPAAAEALVDDLFSRLTDGAGLLVHCGAGIGRAGTLAAALLLRAGEPLSAALGRVRASRPMAGPEAGAQDAMLRDLADR